MSEVIVRTSAYDERRLRPLLFDMLARLDGGRIQRGTRVLVKPNLLSPAATWSSGRFPIPPAARCAANAGKSVRPKRLPPAKATCPSIMTVASAVTAASKSAPTAPCAPWKRLRAGPSAGLRSKSFSSSALVSPLLIQIRALEAEFRYSRAAAADSRRSSRPGRNDRPACPKG